MATVVLLLCGTDRNRREQLLPFRERGWKFWPFSESQLFAIEIYLQMLSVLDLGACVQTSFPFNRAVTEYEVDMPTQLQSHQRVEQR